MKAAITVTLTASLIASSMPALAQFPGYVPRPRYAQPPLPAPPAPISSDWTRVRAIAPGSRISVIAVGLGDQDHQYFVSASDQQLTLLIVGNVPRSVKRLAVKLAAEHPYLLTAPGKWFEFKDGRARVNPDGLFVGGHKVADLGEVIKIIDAGDVAEVAADMEFHRPPRDFGTPPPIVGGAFVAALYGTLAICKAKCGSAALLPIIGIPVAVGIIAARKSTRAMQVVYRVR